MSRHKFVPPKKPLRDAGANAHEQGKQKLAQRFPPKPKQSKQGPWKHGKLR